MKKISLLFCWMIISILSLAQCPDAIDLNSWMQQGLPSNGNWSVASDGSSVVQTINQNVTLFVSQEEFINTTINGSFKVNLGGLNDNDWIGFVFGYQAPLANPLEYNFLLFDWKQSNQNLSSFGGQTFEGFSLMRINKVFSSQNAVNAALGAKAPQAGVEVLASDFGSDKGWEENVEYNFELDFTETNIKISINGNLIFDVDGNFSVGKFGFYNFSQANVEYMGFAESLSFNTYYADMDGDGFGDPNNIVEACSLPSDASTNSGDCNDNNPNINPTSTEIPDNGIDEDCTGGDLITNLTTCIGDIILTTQAQVDNFDMTCEVIDGNLIINGNDINNLSKLSGVKIVTGFVFIGDSTLNVIGNDILPNLEGLNNITSIGGDLTICNNPSLLSLNGFSSLASVGGDIQVKNCVNLQSVTFVVLNSAGGDCIYRNLPSLNSINIGGFTTFSGSIVIDGTGISSLTNSNGTGIGSLNSIGGNLFIENNPNLSNIDLPNLINLGGCLHVINNVLVIDLSGLSSLAFVGENIRIVDNDEITNVDNFINLTTVNGSVFITGNDNLINLDGLVNLSAVADSLVITDNPNLNSCCGVYPLLSTNGVGNTIIINNNLAGCNSESDIITACGPQPDDVDADGITDALDNCPNTYNPNQIDADNDTAGLACDCDDNNVNTYPNAPEIADGLDNNCNNQIDEGVIGPGNLTIACPSDIVVTVPQGETERIVGWIPPVITSSCQWGYTAGTNGPGNGGVFQLGETVITEWVFDGCGEVASCTFTVTVVQQYPNTPITISCPADIIVMAPMGQSQMQVNWIEPINSSNCQLGFTAGQNGLANGSLFDIGTTEVEYWIFDGCGNSESCTFNVTVETELTMTCPSYFEIAAPSGASSAIIVWDDPVVNSSCGGIDLVQNGGLAKGSMFPIGWSCISYQATDACNNVTDCTFCFEVLATPLSPNGSTTLIAPIEILHLESQLKNANQVQLDWYINISLDNQIIVIERSEDGTDFYPIETLDDVTPHSQLSHFQIVDQHPILGENHYRIRIIDPITGNHISNQVLENIDLLKQFAVYPNPAYKNFFVNLKNFEGKKCEIQLTNALGQVVFQKETIASDYEPFEININQIKNGIYFISVKPEGNRMMSQRIVVDRLD